MRPLTPREAVIVAVAVIAGVVLPLYRFVFGPELATVASLNHRIEAQNREVVRLEAAANRLPAVRGEHTELARRVAEMEQQMPATVGVSTLMGRLSQAIATSGVQLIEVTFPAGTQPSVSAAGGIQELAFTVRCRGTFAGMIAFLQVMEGAPPMAAEQSLGIVESRPPIIDGKPAGVEMTADMKAFALR